MVTEQEARVLAREAVEAFRSVESRLRSLHERSERLAGGASGEISEIRSEATALADYLSSYLRSEEKGQLFECLLDHLPESSSTIEELRSEHLELGRIAVELVDATAELDAESAASFSAEVLSFIEVFHRHEDRETRLYQRVCFRDAAP